MSFLIRIVRPEHAIVLLRETRDDRGVLLGYESVHDRNGATRYGTLEYARATVRMLIDANEKFDTNAMMIAWAYKKTVLQHEPWTDNDGKVDEHANPEDWEHKLIEGSTISILSPSLKTLESFPFEVK